MKNILTLLMVTMLIGCATQSIQSPSAKSNTVKPATSDDVKNCEYLDDLIGTSGWYGVFATQGVENARAEILTKAANIGATHIVWQSNNVGYGSTSVAGRSIGATNDVSIAIIFTKIMANEVIFA